MSGRLDPIAYTYEADHHCPACAFAKFGRDGHGFVPADAVDGEGNPVGAVAPWDEWFNVGYGPQVLVCGDCCTVIGEYDEYEDEREEER